MSSNNFSTNASNESQNYNLNGVSSFYAPTNICTTEEPLSANNYGTGSNLGIGLSGPGTHVEETTIPSSSSGVKSSGRGRRKQRKKLQCPEVLLGEPLKNEDSEEMKDGILLPGDLSYQHNLISEEQHPLQENHLLLNSNTLDHILSIKKMMLLQSPDVIDALRQQQQNDRK